MSEKDKIIKYETWDLNGGMETIEDKVLVYTPSVNKNETLNLIKKHLPDSFLKVLVLHYNIIDPLTAQEELHLLLSSKD